MSNLNPAVDHAPLPLFREKLFPARLKNRLKLAGRKHRRSRKPENVLAEVRRLVKAGYKEVILTGIHLGSYGRDLDDA
ncbi:MAG: hypothetical protein M1379_00785, partial [Firmicutes bacterium]|nr:hypothetical protein [Bacillota bacterium]